MTAYSKPTIQSMDTSQIVDLLGPAHAYGTTGNGLESPDVLAGGGSPTSPAKR